ncbi:putative Cystathionine beta-synthase [Hypsibius exemplaris]|uniref:Cystathionine beta-synthase n=1 Tax=Hypsibius exemplaris TaxID=2072580 RepID=A0A9X6RNH6_HYPEX|nr:putative Cystathionine beta-synthase [Hypsibius exemplaris]
MEQSLISAGSGCFCRKRGKQVLYASVLRQPQFISPLLPHGYLELLTTSALTGRSCKKQAKSELYRMSTATSPRHLMVAHSITDLVGGTPALCLKRMFPDHHVLAKLEFLNPLLSVKDRPALHLVEAIARTQLVAPGGLLIVPTSGNFGLAVATFGRLHGYRVVAVMASDTAEAKQKLLQSVCGEVIVCDGSLNSNEPGGYVHTARQLANNTPNSYVVDQFHNPLNPEAHYFSTGPELLQQMDGRIDIFFSIMGTGGTFSGVSRYLIERSPATRIVLVDVHGGIIKMSHDGGVPAWRDHPVSSISDNFIPSTADLSFADMVIEVSGESAFEFSRRAREKEGLFVGASAGAVLSGIQAYIDRYGLAAGARIGCVLGDSSRTYGSKLCDKCPEFSHLEAPVLLPRTPGVLHLNRQLRHLTALKADYYRGGACEITLTSVSTNISESVIALYTTTGEQLAAYIYEKSDKINDMGRCLMKGALVSWAVVDLCFASDVVVKLTGNDNELTALKKYILDSFHLATSLYERLYNLPRAEIKFFEYSSAGAEVSEVRLNIDKYLLGFSGGKDSTLSYEIMTRAGVDVTKFQVVYDDNEIAAEGRIRKTIHNEGLYSIVSPSRRSPVYGTFEHQEDDIHATILAPYTVDQDGKPATVALGLPWEVLHCLNDSCPDLVPSETARSLQSLEQFARSLGLTHFKVVSPIANLSSFGVFRMLAKWRGRDSLTTFYSCWQENPDLSACGQCTKCKRVGLVESLLFEDGHGRASADDLPPFAKMFGSVYSELFLTHRALCGSSLLLDDVTALATEQKFTDAIAAADFAPLDVVGLTVGLNVLSKA